MNRYSQLELVFFHIKYGISFQLTEPLCSFISLHSTVCERRKLQEMAPTNPQDLKCRKPECAALQQFASKAAIDLHLAQVHNIGRLAGGAAPRRRNRRRVAAPAATISAPSTPKVQKPAARTTPQSVVGAVNSISRPALYLKAKQAKTADAAIVRIEAAHTRATLQTGWAIVLLRGIDVEVEVAMPGTNWWMAYAKINSLEGQVAPTTTDALCKIARSQGMYITQPGKYSVEVGPGDEVYYACESKKLSNQLDDAGEVVTINRSFRCFLSGA
jgi:hypothetical protein